MIHSLRRACASVVLACAATTLAHAAPVKPLPVYQGAPLASYHLTVADSESSTLLAGARASVTPPPDTPTREVIATRSGKELTLQWKDAWYAALRVDGGRPLDLRPYLAHGVLALDVRVDELARGGLAFKVGCGERCERFVSYVVPARAAQGKGWQHLSYAMSCFVRDGADFSAIKLPFALEATGAGKVAIANVRLIASATPTMACPDYRTASVTPAKLDESWSIDWWTPRHEKKLQDARALGKQAQVVFIGDSITEGWEKSGAPVWDQHYKNLNALALGFGGDRTENVLWRLQHGEVDALAPQVAVLMFGTNNTGHRKEDPATTAAGIRRNIDELRQRLPDTRILLLAIFPRGAGADDELRRINDRVNAIIAGYADNQHVYYLDIGKSFLQPDGTLSKEIMPDLLHPNQKGYEIWAEAMAPTLNQLLGGAASPAYAWRPVAIGGSGFISGIIPSKTQKGLVYLRTDVGGAYRRDGQLTRQLAFAIHAQRVGGVVFGIGRSLAAIEHVVGGVVDQGDAQGRRFFSKHARGDGIDRKGQFRLVFGLVHGGVGCGNDEQIRLVRPHLGTDLPGLAQVQHIAAQDDQLAQAGKVLL